MSDSARDWTNYIHTSRLANTPMTQDQQEVYREVFLAGRIAGAASIFQKIDSIRWRDHF